MYITNGVLYQREGRKPLIRSNVKLELKCDWCDQHGSIESEYFFKIVGDLYKGDLKLTDNVCKGRVVGETHLCRDCFSALCSSGQ